MDIEFYVPNLGEHSDLPDNELPLRALRLCQNMYRNEKGRLVIRPGYDLLSTTNPGGRIMGIGHFKTAAGVETSLVANKTGVWTYNGSVWVDITGAALSGGNTDHVRFETFAVAGTYKTIIMNGVNTPKIWNGVAATYSDLGGTPGVFIDAAVVANRLVGLVAPDLVKISDFNDPETYPAGNGFNVRLIDAGDYMVGIDRLSRTSAAVLGEGSQWVGRAQSGSNPMRFEKIDEKPGPLSAAAMVRVGSAIYYLGEDYNVYRFDGTYPCTPVGFAMWPFVTASIDESNRKMSHGTFMERLNKVFFWFPSSGSSVPNLGIFYDVTTGEMGRLSYANVTASGRIRVATGITWEALGAYTWDTIEVDYPTWDAFGDLSAERRNALGDSLGNVYVSGAGDGSDNGQAIEAIWEIPLKAYGGWMNAFDPESFDTFFRKAANSTTVQPSLGFTNTLMDDPEYFDLDPFDLNTDQRNSVDLSEVSQKRFVTLRHKVLASKGQVEWYGGVLRGNEQGISAGPTGTVG